MLCQVHREPVPEELGASELTSLCYGASPLLYCGSSSGQVCVWDTGTGRCFLAWEADEGEIGGCPTTSVTPKCTSCHNLGGGYLMPILSSRSAAVLGFETGQWQ